MTNSAKNILIQIFRKFCLKLFCLMKFEIWSYFFNFQIKNLLILELFNSENIFNRLIFLIHSFVSSPTFDYYNQKINFLLIFVFHWLIFVTWSNLENNIQIVFRLLLDWINFFRFSFNNAMAIARTVWKSKETNLVCYQQLLKDWKDLFK